MTDFGRETSGQAASGTSRCAQGGFQNETEFNNPWHAFVGFNMYVTKRTVEPQASTPGCLGRRKPGEREPPSPAREKEKVEEAAPPQGKGGGKQTAEANNENDEHISRKMVRILRYGGNRLKRPADGWVRVQDLERSLHISEGSVMRIAQSSMRRQGQPRFVIENGFVRATENGEDWAGASGKGAGKRAEVPASAGQVQLGRPLATKVEERDLELRSDEPVERGPAVHILDDAFFDPGPDTDNRMPKALCCGMKHLVSARFFVDPNVPRKWIENWLVHYLQESIENIRVNYLHRYQYQGRDYDEIAVWWNQDLGKLMSFMNMDMQQTLNDDIMGEWRRKGVRQPEVEHVAERIKMAHGFCKDQSTSSQSSEGGRS